MKIDLKGINNNKAFQSDKKVVCMDSLYSEGAETEWHTHKRHQLIVTYSGVNTVETERGFWVVPPMRAVFLPKNTLHKIEITKKAHIRSLFISASVEVDIPSRSTVIQISPLLKELLSEVYRLPQSFSEDGANGRLIAVIFDQLCKLPTEPLYIPSSQEPRIRRILDTLYHDPANQKDLKTWASELGMSARSLTRLFEKELNVNFVHCRHQIRMQAALKALAQNKPVGTVALEVGCSSQSNFTMLFRRYFGVTPKQYFE